MTLEQIIDCLQSRYADKVFVAKDYTKADLILDLQSIASPRLTEERTMHGNTKDGSGRMTERAADAERLARLREFYDGCREVDEERRDGIGHVVFLLRLITNRDATIARLQQTAKENLWRAVFHEQAAANIRALPDEENGK